MSAGHVTLADVDALELGEMLEFIYDFTNYAPDVLADLFKSFVGGYSLSGLRADLARFMFLVGGPGDHFINGTQP